MPTQWVRFHCGSKKHGVELIDYSPHCLSGDKDSDVIEWAHRFFVPHLPVMAERGACSREHADALIADWLAHRQNPATMFFSPLVVDAAGRKK